MQGLMMDYPLTLQHAYNRAVRLFPRKEIVTRTEDGLHRYTYREWGKRTAQLAHALHKAGFKEGDFVTEFNGKKVAGTDALGAAFGGCGLVVFGVAVWVLADRLAPLHPGMKVLFVSGYRHDTLEDEGIFDRGVNLLPKPFPASELLRRVQLLLTSKAPVR